MIDEQNYIYNYKNALLPYAWFRTLNCAQKMMFSAKGFTHEVGMHKTKYM